MKTKLSALLCILLLPLATVAAAELTLSWQDNADNETGFALERADGPDGAFAEIVRLGADVTSYTDRGLQYATKYSYRIRAYNAGGLSDFSNTATGTTEDAPPPPTQEPPAAPSAMVTITITTEGAAEVNVESP